MNKQPEPELNEYGFNWQRDCQPMLDQAKENLHVGIIEWLPVPQTVALYFLEVVPPAFHQGGTFACGEPYDHDSKGRAIYLCFQGLEITGFREEPAYASVCVLRANTGEKPARACYLTLAKLKEI